MARDLSGKLSPKVRRGLIRQRDMSPIEPIDHEYLDGILGGDSNGHYHLTEDQHDAITGANDPNGSNPFATLEDLEAIDSHPLLENLGWEESGHTCTNDGERLAGFVDTNASEYEITDVIKENCIPETDTNGTLNEFITGLPKASQTAVMDDAVLTGSNYSYFRLIRSLVESKGGNIVIDLDDDDPMTGEFTILNSAGGGSGRTTTINAPTGGNINGEASVILTEEEEAVTLQYIGFLTYRITARANEASAPTVTPSDTVSDETTWGIPPDAGDSNDYARGDHTHGTPTMPTAEDVGADANGTAASLIGDHESDYDHTHIPTGDQKDALDNAASPSAANPLATVDDLDGVDPTMGGDISGTASAAQVDRLAGNIPVIHFTRTIPATGSYVELGNWSQEYGTGFLRITVTLTSASNQMGAMVYNIPCANYGATSWSWCYPTYYIPNDLVNRGFGFWIYRNGTTWYFRMGSTNNFHGTTAKVMVEILSGNTNGTWTSTDASAAWSPAPTLGTVYSPVCYLPSLSIPPWLGLTTWETTLSGTAGNYTRLGYFPSYDTAGGGILMVQFSAFGVSNFRWYWLGAAYGKIGTYQIARPMNNIYHVGGGSDYQLVLYGSEVRVRSIGYGGTIRCTWFGFSQFTVSNATGTGMSAPTDYYEGNSIEQRSSMAGVNKVPVCTFDVNGGFATALVSKSADYAMTKDDHTVLVSDTKTITLPAANLGQRVRIINIGSGKTVTIQRAGSDNIIRTGSSVTSFTLTAQYEIVELESNKSNLWYEAEYKKLDGLAAPDDNTKLNVTSTAHGLAPKSPADATKFLDGGATPAFDYVRDSDLSLTDITTNDVSESAHGFQPKIGKIKFTAEGGLAIKLTNKTGGASVAGTIVAVDTTADNAYKNAPADSVYPVGVVYNSVAGDAEGWVVVAGIADVLFKDGVAPTRATAGYVFVSDTIGRADIGTDTGVASHNREIGHCLEEKSSGTDVKAKCILHWN